MQWPNLLSIFRTFWFPDIDLRLRPSFKCFDGLTRPLEAAKMQSALIESARIFFTDFSSTTSSFCFLGPQIITTIHMMLQMHFSTTQYVAYYYFVSVLKPSLGAQHHFDNQYGIAYGNEQLLPQSRNLAVDCWTKTDKWTHPKCAALVRQQERSHVRNSNLNLGKERNASHRKAHTHYLSYKLVQNTAHAKCVPEC